MSDASASLDDAGKEEMIRANWGWFVLRGVLAIILGLVALVMPRPALLAFTMVFAAFAFVDGLFSLASGIRGARRKEQRWGTFVLRGCVGIVVGMLFVLMPFVATISYALATLVLVALWSILVGVFEIAAAIRLRKEIRGEWLLALSGLLSILLGLAIPLLLMAYPGATILSAAWIIGIYALAAGIVLLLQGLRLRSGRQPGTKV